MCCNLYYVPIVTYSVNVMLVRTQRNWDGVKEGQLLGWRVGRIQLGWVGEWGGLVSHEPADFGAREWIAWSFLTHWLRILRNGLIFRALIPGPLRPCEVWTISPWQTKTWCFYYGWWVSGMRRENVFSLKGWPSMLENLRFTFSRHEGTKTPLLFLLPPSSTERLTPLSKKFNDRGIGSG